jgi:predicted methyltransferase
VSEAEWDALERAHENENAAFDALVTTPPETSLGMRAIIAHLISIDDGPLSQEMRRLLALLLDSPLMTN